jgi:tRNA(fMet)-specific endonuclease VapC
MKYLLDTNVCIAFLNGTSRALINRLQNSPEEDIAVCSIVKAELWFGAEKSRFPIRTRYLQNEFLKPYKCFSFDESAAEAYAKIRADLTQKGTLIGPNDLLIAAIALAYRLILVTHNTREFSRVEQLHLEDWLV